MIEEAAAKWKSLAMIHGFIDGNKRVALACTTQFLQANRVETTGSEDDWIESIYSYLEAGTFRKEVLEGWLNRQTQPL